MMRLFKRSHVFVAWVIIAYVVCLQRRSILPPVRCTPILPEHMSTDIEGDSPGPPLPMSSDFQVSPQERSAPQAISPIIMPSVAPVVSAPSSSAAAEAVGPSEGNSKHEESATSGGTAEPSQTCVSKPPSGPSAEEQWIKIMGILVPAIVAIGLGIGGFCVTLHVNSPKRMRDNGKDSEDGD